MNNNDLLTRLHEIANEEYDSIQKEVAQEFFNHSYEKVEHFFEDLRSNGCMSGMITKLIYYRDTHAFFIKHYDEIEDLRQTYEEQTGMTLQPQGDLMNWHAWFAFEEVARNLAVELEIFK